MISHGVARLRDRRRSGFTLIEVLMATFIIGLGVLGLAALFAGAARQQQVATQTTNATLQSSNVDALIGRSLGVLGGTNLAVSGNRPDRVDAGVWYAIPTSDIDDSLSIDFAQDGTRDGDLYFLVYEDQPAILYDRTTTPTQFVPPQGNILIYFDQQIGQFPRPQVDCGATSEIRVIYSEVQDPTQRGVQVYRYASPCEIVGAGLTNIPTEWGVDQSWQADCQNDAQNDSPGGVDRESQIIEQWSRGVFFLNGVVNSNNWIVVDRGVASGGGAPPASRLMAARFDILLGGTPQWQLERIDVPLGYSWRNDRVVSLQDRVLTRPDSTSINGRRPDIGFALLFRRLSNGSGQVGVFTYQITGMDGRGLRPGSFTGANIPRDLFQPFEELRNLEPSASGYRPLAPLRLFRGVQLLYNSADDYYYIIPGGGDFIQDSALTSPGQLLLVKSRVQGAEVHPGADDAVRVVRQYFMPNGWPAAEIDRVPRSVGESMLHDRGTFARIDVWAIQGNVYSRDVTPNRRASQSAQWKLEPLDFTILQVE